MVSPEHGRSSNSPNVKILKLTIEGTNGNLLCAALDDGSLFLFDLEHPLASELSVGMELDESLQFRLESASEAYRCRRKALDLLARAEHSRRGLEQKLYKREFSSDHIKQALDRLESAGSLDDRRFAESWLRSRLRNHPEGPVRLMASLASKGVAGSVASAAVETVLAELDDMDAENALERAWAKLSRKSGMNDEKLLRALVRRGFPAFRVRALLKRMRLETEDS